jgi:hypothetical protein
VKVENGTVEGVDSVFPARREKRSCWKSSCMVGKSNIVKCVSVVVEAWDEEERS